MTEEREARVRTIAQALREHIKDKAEELSNCEHLKELSDAELAVHCLVELVVDEVGAIRSHFWEYYNAQVSSNGIRLLRACSNQLDRVDGAFYSRNPEQAVRYIAGILDDAYAILEQEYAS